MPKRAGFWIRTLAAVIDALLISLFFFCLAILVVMLHPAARNSDLNPKAVNIMVYGVWLAYSTLEIWTAGTPGKLLLRLRIAAIDATPADGWRKSLRWSTKQLPAIAMLLYMTTGLVPAYALAGFSSLFVFIGCFFASNDDHLAWHDNWARTAVYWKRSIDPDPQPRGFPVMPTVVTPTIITPASSDDAN